NSRCGRHFLTYTINYVKLALFTIVEKLTKLFKSKPESPKAYKNFTMFVEKTIKGFYIKISYL
ncbi:MAG: hypothetical protein ACTSQU_17915, partial [Promethearchaeota archaeon]